MIESVTLKEQVENLRVSLLNAIDCMANVQMENDKLKSRIHELETICNIYEHAKQSREDTKDLKMQIADLKIGWNMLKQQNERLKATNEELYQEREADKKELHFLQAECKRRANKIKHQKDMIRSLRSALEDSDK